VITCLSRTSSASGWSLIPLNPRWFTPAEAITVRFMFFEPVPAGEVTATEGFRLPERPLWSGPPPLETGAVLAVEQTVARSPNVVLRLPTIRAFRTGCMLDVEVASRQGGLSEDDWWDLHSSAHVRSHQVRGGAALPRKLLRLGVRYAFPARPRHRADHHRTRRRSHRGRRQPVGLLLARDRAR
jgi:hypothetical protein